MKICKVKIRKHFKDGVCHNHYPDGYNANKINVVSYDENPLTEGDNVGYCIGTVPDDFVFTDDMVEISRVDAESFIDVTAEVHSTKERKDKYKLRKGHLV